MGMAMAKQLNLNDSQPRQAGLQKAAGLQGMETSLIANLSQYWKTGQQQADQRWSDMLTYHDKTLPTKKTKIHCASTCWLLKHITKSTWLGYLTTLMQIPLSSSVSDDHGIQFAFNLVCYCEQCWQQLATTCDMLSTKLCWFNTRLHSQGPTYTMNSLQVLHGSQLCAQISAIAIQDFVTTETTVHAGLQYGAEC